MAARYSGRPRLSMILASMESSVEKGILEALGNPREDLKG